jgi:radical SAM-linked protein
MASEAEYVEIAVVERLHPEAVRFALDDALPTGYDVIKVVEAQPGSLSDRLEASLWELRFPGVAVPDLDRAVEPFRRSEHVEVTRTMSSGIRRFDAREPVLQVVSTGDEDGLCAILHVVVRHTTPSVRPDDILTAIRGASPVDLPPPMVRRLAQGPLSADPLGVGDPLSTDQAAIGT